jgi:iron complex outermembrane receptor protein
MARFPVSKLALSYTYIQSSFDDITGYTSKYLGNPLQYQFGAQLLYRYCSWITHGWQMKYEKRMTEQAYTLCDTRLTMHIWNAALFFDCTNLFDTKYLDIATVPMPGRWFNVGLTVELKKKE